MKSKEEIEQLAEQYYISDYNTEEEQSAAESGYIDGYLQCQEDMADKKYTEEDVKKAFDSGYDIISSYGDRDDNMTAEQYINSLNKQDNENI